MKKILSIFFLLPILSTVVVAQQRSDAKLDSSHIIISAIKTVSGTAPDNEFFSLSWKIRFGEWFLSIANLDMALTNQGTDSVSSSQKKLSEAGLTIAYDFGHLGPFRKDRAYSYRNDLKRTIYSGLSLKVFNTESYLGAMAGSIELPNSNFEGTYFHIGYLRRFFPLNDTSSRFNINNQRLANDNLYAEFFIHSEEQNFFKYLTIRGGVLAPLLGSKGTFDDIQFRIVVSVPIGGLFKIDKQNPN